MNLVNFMTLRNDKVENNKFKIKNIWSFYHNALQKMGRRNSSQIILLKRILSWQSKFNNILLAYLLARSNVLHFSTKKSLPYIENSKLLKETFGHVWWHQKKKKKIEIYFPNNTFVFHVLCCLYYMQINNTYITWTKGL